MTPESVFLDWLNGRPAGARVAIVVDSDGLLGEAGLLAKPSVVDAGGRSWRLTTYRGDDLAFRLRYRSTLETPPVAIVLARDPGSAAPLDVSTITDLLGRNEGGQPLDLSFPSLLRRIAPKINFPAAEVRRWKAGLLPVLPEVKEAAGKIIERWGKPDDWGRGQVAALALLARHPGFTLKEIWADETDPADFVAHLVRLLGATPALAADRELVCEVLREAARPQVGPYLFWLEVEPGAMAAYVVLRRLAHDRKLENPATLLAGLQAFPPETPLGRMDEMALSVAERLRRQLPSWSALEARAERSVPRRALARLAELVKGTAAAIPGLDLPAFVLRPVLTGLLASFFAKPGSEQLAWVSGLAGHPILGSSPEGSGPAARACRSALGLLLTLERVERGLESPLPTFGQPGALLDWFVASGTFRMELEVSEAAHAVRELLSGDALESGLAYLFGGGGELSPEAGSLKARVRGRLQELDGVLADFVRPDPGKFLTGTRSILGFVQEEAAGSVAAELRVWILLFDGMRLDLWETLVAPLLAEHFTLEGKPRFAILPSFTGIARTSLFAGRLPEAWVGPEGAATRSEPALLARNLGLAPQQVSAKLRFLTEADTAKALATLGTNPGEAGLVNVLVYPIADDCHGFGGDLAAFASKIRTDLVGDRSHGVRGILDDLLDRVRPGDTVLATSDHGFVELLAGDSVVVGAAEATAAGRSLTEDVRFRYVAGFRPAGMPEAVTIPGEVPYHVAVGRRWFWREGTKNVPRYEHGGLSLGELAIPAVVLRRVTEKEARVELDGLPEHALPVEEDARLELPVTVLNSGNVALSYELQVSTNLGEVVGPFTGTLQPGEKTFLRPAVVGRYRLTPAREPDPGGTLRTVTFRLRQPGLDGVWRDARGGLVAVPILVKPKKTRLDTDALKGFDEI